jgi:hypothetical protein
MASVPNKSENNKAHKIIGEGHFFHCYLRIFALSKVEEDEEENELKHESNG